MVTVGVAVFVGVVVGDNAQVTLGVGVFVLVTVGVTVFVGVFVGVLDGSGVFGKGIFSIISKELILAEVKEFVIAKIVLSCSGCTTSLFLTKLLLHSL